MKVLFCGVGSIGKRHIRNLISIISEKGQTLELHLLRSSERSLEDDIQSKVTKVVHSYDELDEWYDAVFITNPTYLHFDTMVHTRNLSDNFFVEKPLFDRYDIDIDEFDKIPEKVYYVACPLRHTKVLKRAKEIIDNEKVISVRSISSSYLPEWRPGTDYRDTYSSHKNQGGGVKIDLIHEWDYLTYLFGFPAKVFELDGTLSELEIDSEDLAVYIAAYRDKMVELHLDYFGRFVRRSCEILTPDDFYIFDIAKSKVERNNEIIEQFSEEPNDKYIEEMKYFLKLIDRKTDNINNLRHSINVMKLTEGLLSV